MRPYEITAPMPHIIRLATESDASGIAEVFNYYITNGFAAYPESPVDAQFLTRLRSLTGAYPIYVIESSEQTVVGFATIRPYHFADSLRRTAEVAYFILPGHTGHGLGSRVLAMLEADAKSSGVDTFLASISSRNGQSIHFHEKHGFTECGRFRRVGKKFDQDYDIVWMQKFI